MVAKLERGSRSVLEATQERIGVLFDLYDNIQLSFSGGKDSTALFHLIRAEAKKRGRKFYLYFQDQEAEYQSTIDLVEWAMQCPEVIPLWWQVEIAMTNATSEKDLFLNAWGEGEDWIREKHPLAIKSVGREYPKRFYDFNRFVEGLLKEREGSSVSVVGLRAEESPERRFVLFGGDTKHFWLYPKGKPAKAYPIIDWSFTDIWKYLTEGGLEYNKAYDGMFAMGASLREMRVSNLIHEKAYRSLAELQRLEPHTYDKLEQRLEGVHGAGRYAKDGLSYSVRKLPEAFKSWEDYRDSLLESTPLHLRKHYEGSGESARHVVRRILLNDWEGELKEPERERKNTLQQWADML